MQETIFEVPFEEEVINYVQLADDDVQKFVSAGQGL